jgi:hypothetical protein
MLLLASGENVDDDVVGAVGTDDIEDAEEDAEDAVNVDDEEVDVLVSDMCSQRR